VVSQIELAQNLIAVKISLAAGSDVADVEPSVVASDEFLLYDYPPASKPRGDITYCSFNCLEEEILCIEN
jgi:hypothetical protein